jgi:hypothetical protein
LLAGSYAGVRVKTGGDAVDYEAEIKDIKAALLETQIGVVGLSVCVAQTLVACDPRSHAMLSNTLRRWLGTLEKRARPEAKEIAVIFGRVFVDPAFPLSSTPPDEDAE